MRFILDENVSLHLVPSLNAIGGDVTHIITEFGKGVKDSDLLPQIAAQGWILVTTDSSMTRPRGAHGHLAVLEETRVRVLFLPKRFCSYRGSERAAWLMKYWAGICEQAGKIDALRVRIDIHGNLTPK